MPSSMRPAWTWASPPSASALVSRFDVAEAAGPVERQLGGRQQLGRIVDLAAHPGDGHPALLDARRLVGDEAAGAGEPRPAAGRLPSALAITSPRRDARHRGPAVVAGCGELTHRGRQVGQEAVDDAAARLAGRTIGRPVHALWGDRRNDAANAAVLATWRRWTAADQPVTGRPLPCGHFIPEERPDLLLEELRGFLG